MTSAPNAANETVFPSDRNKITVELATPISANSTLFCTARVLVGIVPPTQNPMKAIPMTDIVSPNVVSSINIKLHIPTIAAPLPSIGHLRYFPVADVRRPTTSPEIVVMLIIGTSKSPEFVGEIPVTACKNKGINAPTDISIPPRMAIIGRTTCITGLRNRRSGIMGLAVRGSVQINNVNKMQVNAAIVMLAEDAQPYSSDVHENIKISDATDEMSKKAPR